MTERSLDELIHYYSQIQEEFSRGFRGGGLERVSWEEIRDALQSRGIVTTNIAKKRRLLAINACRRGPAVAGDASDISKTIMGTSIREYKAPRIPGVTLSQDVGYLIKGLPGSQQQRILKFLRVTSSLRSVSLDGVGPDLLEVSSSTTRERLWTLPSAEVNMTDWRHCVAEILQIGGVRPEVSDLISDLMPKSCTLEEGLVQFSNRSLELLLRKLGYDVKVDTSPLTVSSSPKLFDALAIEQSIRSGLEEAVNVEKAPWYQPMRNSVGKLLRGCGNLSPEEARRKWLKVIKVNRTAANVLDLDENSFGQAVSEGLNPEEAFLQSLIIRCDLGSVLYDATMGGIRIGKTEGKIRFSYTSGKQALIRILELVAEDREMAVGFQQFDERAETGFMLARLAQVAKERGEPVPGVVVFNPDSKDLDVSIIKALREL